MVAFDLVSILLRRAMNAGQEGERDWSYSKTCAMIVRYNRLIYLCM